MSALLEAMSASFANRRAGPLLIDRAGTVFEQFGLLLERRVARLRRDLAEPVSHLHATQIGIPFLGQLTDDITLVGDPRYSRFVGGRAVRADLLDDVTLVTLTGASSSLVSKSLPISPGDRAFEALEEARFAVRRHRPGTCRRPREAGPNPDPPRFPTTFCGYSCLPPPTSLGRTSTGWSRPTACCPVDFPRHGIGLRTAVTQANSGHNGKGTECQGEFSA